jgi:hypothetical protein
MIVHKIVDPGDWPSRSGIAIPGHVIPPDLELEWGAAPYTRDIMGTQMLEYVIEIPDNKRDQVEVDKGEYEDDEDALAWIINFKCRYKLKSIINPTTIDLPQNIGIIVRNYDPDEGIGGNFAIDLDADIEEQLKLLSGWEDDEISDIVVIPDYVQYYSANVQSLLTFEIRQLK